MLTPRDDYERGAVDALDAARTRLPKFAAVLLEAVHKLIDARRREQDLADGWLDEVA